MGADRPTPRRAVFLDRDGVINRNVLNPATGEHEAPLTAADFALIPGVLDALRQLQRASFLLFLVSNQPNVAKRKSTLADLNAIHAAFLHQLSAAHVEFAAFYYCLHHPDGTDPAYSGPCVCRKPSPHFPFRARDEFAVDLPQSWMIGDRATDILCGRAAGARTILIRTDPANADDPDPDYVVLNLAAAANLICATTPPLTAA